MFLIPNAWQSFPNIKINYITFESSKKLPILVWILLLMWTHSCVHCAYIRLNKLTFFLHFEKWFCVDNKCEPKNCAKSSEKQTTSLVQSKFSRGKLASQPSISILWPFTQTLLSTSKERGEEKPQMPQVFFYFISPFSHLQREEEDMKK